MKNQKIKPGAYKTVSRRGFLQTVAAGAGGVGLGLAGCGPSSRDRNEPQSGGERPFAGQTLRVFVYSGAWEKGFREQFVPRFEEATGARVVVDPGWWDSIPKLKASPPDQPAFDLILTDATQGYPAIREGLFQQLDFSRIPNRKNLAPSVLDNWVVEEGYGITFPESVMTLGYHRELCPQAPDSWADLSDPAYDGKLGLYNSFYMSLYTFAGVMVAAEGRAGTAHQEMARNLQGVIDFARSQRDRVKFWWPTSTDMALNLSQRNVALGNMHSPDMILALRNDPKLGAVVPAEDQAYVLLMWVVAAHSQVSELAHAAIDMLLSEEVQQGLAATGQVTAHPAAARTVAEADALWKSIYPSTPEELAAVQYYPYDVYMKNWDDLKALWEREILRS